ncbi:FtsW/RodA/SpoVE family cell cycle protein [Deinococcus caeni]|uniref:FtsW/RodA/SpoVE family cell cycle protein n=1 Tax=Deinococcus caeni TaxID=569127 RepID=UPI00361A47E4
MKYDLRFPVVIAALLVVGLMTVSTAALSPRASSGVFNKQLMGVALAAVPIALLWWAGRDRIYRAAPYLYGLALLMQLSTFVIGKEVNGQRNWIVIGPLQFQPLEILKFALILMLAVTLREGSRAPERTCGCWRCSCRRWGWWSSRISAGRWCYA